MRQQSGVDSETVAQGNGQPLELDTVLEGRVGNGDLRCYIATTASLSLPLLCAQLRRSHPPVLSDMVATMVLLCTWQGHQDTFGVPSVLHGHHFHGDDDSCCHGESRARTTLPIFAMATVRRHDVAIARCFFDISSNGEVKLC